MTSPTHAHDPANNLRGIAAMLGAMAAFVLNDALVKLAAVAMPMGEVIFLRGIFTVLLCFGLLMATESPLSLRHAASPRIIARGLMDVGSALTFLFALRNMPIADAYAILQFTPLGITAGAALFLGAKVGWRRWLATTVGLVGVMVIIKPGAGTFNASSVLAIISIGFSVARDLITRGIGLNVPAMVIALASPVLLTTITPLFSAFEPWRAPSLAGIAYVVGAGILLLIGQLALIKAMRTGEIAVVAPFRYSIIIWSILAGLVIWHELPDFQTCLGIAIVFGAGLYTFLREQKLSRLGRT